MTTTPARYDEFADFYEQGFPDDYSQPPMQALLQLAGDVSGLRLLDLACAHGRLTRELARRGAQVVGVDISAALLAKARARETASPLGIDFVQANVSSPQALDGQSFDGVLCCFGLSDIDDLEGALATVARVLRPGGFFAFAIIHPCFPGWPSKQASPSWQPGHGYYAEGWFLALSPGRGLRPRVGANHRMLSTYLNALARNGLSLVEAIEPPPNSGWLAEPPDTGPVPVFLVARCRRAPTCR